MIYMKFFGNANGRMPKDLFTTLCEKASTGDGYDQVIDSHKVICLARDEGYHYFILMTLTLKDHIQFAFPVAKVI